MMRQPQLNAGLTAAILAAALVACASPVEAAPISEPPLSWSAATAGPFQTVQDRFDAEPLSYSVSWSELRLDPQDEDASATISATAYVRNCECDAASKPVMFFFNGGPGASSSPLHFSMGPKARGEDGVFPENPYTVLRAADLVFIDPVDTGFSRANSEAGQAKYLGVEGDIDAVGRFIQAWLDQNDRSGAPVLLAGQSYGGARLANLVPSLTGLDVRGLVMVSPALDSGAGQTDLGHVFALPTMAATAWRFGRSEIDAASEAESWELAREFAETDYLLALQKGDRINLEEKAVIASAMAAMTGLPAKAILDANLRPGIQFFLETVLAEDGLLVSRLNTARTSPLPSPDVNAHRPAAANDPSLGLGRSNVIVAPDIAEYLTAATGLHTSEDYRSLNLDANFLWDWRGSSRAPRFYVSAAPALSRFMRETPQVKLLVFAGYRDLATPLLATDYALTHNGLPQDRVELVALPGGHSPYDESGLKAEIADKLFTFIQSAVQAAPTSSQESAE
ncbi:MAG: S10 family serine carboxypeptidase-like protein [Hyphomonas sp.]